MKILVGVDGTEKSLEAIRFARQLLAPGRDQVYLYFAPPQRRWTARLSLSAEDQRTTISAFGESILAAARAQLPAAFACQTLTAAKDEKVSRGLLEAARRVGSDLIVVGAGRSSHRLPFFVGGVARTVIHESDRPVLACRAKTTENASAPLKLLLAVDPSDSMETTISLLNQFSWPPGSQGQLIHVMDYVEDERLRHWINTSSTAESSIWSDALDLEVAEQRDQVRARLQDLRDRLPTIFRNTDPLLVVGHVVEQIVQVVEQAGIDLVVVGGRRRGPVARLLGSTTEGLLLQANASILVVHESTDDSSAAED